MLRKPSIDVIGLTRCTGCFGCQSACAIWAIEISLDAEGFYKPIIDRTICNECGFCQHVCPVIVDGKSVVDSGKLPESKAFAAWTNDEKVRLSSSSGGIFSELAKPVIDNGGAVIGCVWGENWIPEHILAHTWDEVQKMRGSKYVPSRVGDVYKQVTEVLRTSDKSVLFSGTPCQVAAMKAALSPEQRKRVLLVEFICHGVPSLRVFHRYLEELFDGDTVVSYTFRDKAFGWVTTMAISAQGNCHHVSGPSDAFSQGFEGYHLYLMEACYECKFAHLPRDADITLGDFWQCPDKWYDKRGVSLVLTNSNAGLSALQLLSDLGRIKCNPAELDSIKKSHRRIAYGGKYTIPNKRKDFLDGLAKGDRFKHLTDKYFPSRIQIWWQSFNNADSKLRFFAAFVSRRIRRLLVSLNIKKY